MPSFGKDDSEKDAESFPGGMMSSRKDGFSIEDVSCKDDASIMVGKPSTDADRYLYGRSVDGASDCRESLPCDRSASAGPEISLSKSATDVSETLTCNRSSAGPEMNIGLPLALLLVQKHCYTIGLPLVLLLVQKRCCAIGLLLVLLLVQKHCHAIGLLLVVEHHYD